MGVSVSVNTSHISYGVAYTVNYECIYTPFDIYLVLFTNSGSSRRMKYVAENLTSSWGSTTFTVSAAEVIAEMADRGEPYPANTPSGIQVCVAPQDTDAILDGHYAETSKLSMDLPTTECDAPSFPTLATTVSRDAVELSWGAGSAGTGNSVTGYDVQYRESSDGSSWGSWTTESGSPVTGTKLNVAPSGTVGNYRQYRVRTRGSAGESWYSGWVTSTNTLRRKWNAFAAWTDATLTARTSMIRAVHLTELQTRVNTIRVFYGLGAYSFTTITARTSKVAKWESLIQEIRTAIDGITTAHESWNTLEAGKPRIAHITQLRSIIDNM